MERRREREGNGRGRMPRALKNISKDSSERNSYGGGGGGGKEVSKEARQMEGWIQCVVRGRNRKESR